MQDIPPQGSNADIFFPRLIAQLHRDGFEGSIRVSVGETTKILYFKAGEIASAASNAEADRLASILIQEGRLTPPQLEMAKSRLTAGGSLGKTLIEMGFLTPGELLQGARRQVRQILVSCCSLANGTYRVEPGPLRPEVTVLGLPTQRLILETILEAADRRWILREIGSMEARYRPTERLREELENLNLDAESDRIVASLDGERTLRDLSGLTSLDDFMVGKTVLAMDVLGLAERAEPPEPAPDDAAGETVWPVADEGQPADDAPEVRDQPAEAGAAPVPKEDEEAEPPGFAPEDLPAFAVSPDETDWQIDPRTGERVHLGPIEITFEGKVAPRTDDRRGFRNLVALTTTITLLIAGLLVYLGRRETPQRGVEQEASNDLQARPAETAGDLQAKAEATAPDRPAPDAPADSPAPLTARQPGVASTPVATPTPAVVASIPRPAETAAPPAAAATPPPSRAVGGTPEPAPATGPSSSSSPFPDRARYADGLRRLEAGDAAGAGRLFDALLGTTGPGRFTLQIMVACEAETLKTAVSHAGPEGALYVLPLALRDRSCYRVCWGVYESKDQAAAALGGLPAPLGGEGRPLVVSIDRLRRS